MYSLSWTGSQVSDVAHGPFVPSCYNANMLLVKYQTISRKCQLLFLNNKLIYIIKCEY